jgi:hypothetical protein
MKWKVLLTKLEALFGMKLSRSLLRSRFFSPKQFRFYSNPVENCCSGVNKLSPVVSLKIGISLKLRSTREFRRRADGVMFGL